MSIPGDMRHVLILALQDACRFAGCGGEEEIHDAYYAALEWVRAQPDAPPREEPAVLHLGRGETEQEAHA